jgi:hypothetical protein
VYQWLHKLRHFRTDERTTLARALREAEPMMENRSVLLVLSDLHDEDAMSVLKPLARKHDCVVLQLQDPAERGGVRGGLFRAEEAETGEAFVSHGRSAWIDPDALGHELSHAGIDHMRLTTNEHFLPHLRAFLRRRDCLGRIAR